MNQNNSKKFVVSTALGLILLLRFGPNNFWSHSTASLEFWSLSGSSAIYLEASSGQRILINTGPDHGIIQKISQKIQDHSRKIDQIIITALDQKHLIGLPEILNRYRVGVLIWPKANSGLPAEKAAREAAVRRGTEIREISDHYDIASGNVEFHLQSLGKLAEACPGISDKALGSASEELVLSVRFGGEAFLIINNGELVKKILHCGAALPVADVLAIGDVGSNLATVKYFLDKFQPKKLIVDRSRQAKGLKALVEMHGARVVDLASGQN